MRTGYRLTTGTSINPDRGGRNLEAIIKKEEIEMIPSFSFYGYGRTFQIRALFRQSMAASICSSRPCINPSAVGSTTRSIFTPRRWAFSPSG